MTKGITLVAASTLEKDIKAKIKNKGGNKSAAELVGTELAKRADKKGIKSVFLIEEVTFIMEE